MHHKRPAFIRGNRANASSDASNSRMSAMVLTVAEVRWLNIITTAIWKVERFSTYGLSMPEVTDTCDDYRREGGRKEVRDMDERAGSSTGTFTTFFFTSRLLMPSSKAGIRLTQCK